MKKTLSILSLLTSLFVYSNAYSHKNDTECPPGYKWCFDLSKARHECLFGCGCNAKNADPCPAGYRCCYDGKKGHHMCVNAECCNDGDCPNSYDCCDNHCFAPNDSSNPCSYGGV